ncbi:MAG: acyl-CoA dehydrogenase family protein [Microthrixaceae bacterium]
MVDVHMAGIEDLRAEVRAFLDGRYALIDPLGDDRRNDIISRTPQGEQRFVDDAVALQRDLAAAGLAAVHVPVEYGGRGLSPAHHQVVQDELARYDTPSLRPLRMGLHLALGTLLRSASDEQKARFIPPLIEAREQWCQLFSEPDAGSDLVALRTKAVRDGDRWRVAGQKVWSSYAARADYGLLLARTDADAERPQAGITMFILPMDAPGVTVRTLVDITGGAHFNEVFLEGVELGYEAILGDLDDGWRVSQGTLGGERSGYMGGSGGGRRRRQVIDAATRAGKLADQTVRQEMMSVVTAERVLEWIRDRYADGSLCGGNPAAGSMMKLAGGSLEQQCAEFVADVSGAAAQAWDAGGADGDIPAHDLAATRQARIAGGTHQIQRNLLGERVLGLPREPR